VLACALAVSPREPLDGEQPTSIHAATGMSIVAIRAEKFVRGVQLFGFAI
jgi:hypothetical protein